MATRDDTIPEQDWPSGRTTSPEVSLINGVKVVEFQIARTTPTTPLYWTSPLTIVRVDLEASFDGGVTWEYAAGLTAEGGPKFDMEGRPGAFTSIRVPYPGRNARLRAHVEVTNGPMRTLITVRSKDEPDARAGVR